MAQAKLSREVGVALLLFYGLGNILGAGIYVLVGKVAGIAGYFSIFAFVLACVILVFTALSYAELVSRYPVSAGAAVYVEEGLGVRTLSVGVGLMMAVAGLVSAATIAHGFAGYLRQFVYIDTSLSMIILIALLVTIAILGIKASVVVAGVLTVVEILGLLLIIYYGFDRISMPLVNYKELIPQLKFSDISMVFLGAFLAVYAFLGFEDMVNIAEEVKEPSKTFPRAIVLALGISTLLYILIVLVALQTLSLNELQHSTAPFADIYKKLTGRDPLLIAMIATFAVINGALIQLIMASRIVYGMATKGWLPSTLAQVSSRTKTPIYSTLLVGLITIAFALLFELVALASYTSMLILIVFTLINISLIRIKSAKPPPQGVMNIPLWVPWAGMLLNLLLITAKLFFDKG